MNKLTKYVAASNEIILYQDELIEELTEAIRLTVEYTGTNMLRPLDGWAWYDALKKAAPEKAQYFVDNPIRLEVSNDTPTI